MSKQQSQLDKFKAAAKQAECNTPVKDFDTALREIAKTPKAEPKAQSSAKTKKND